MNLHAKFVRGIRHKFGNMGIRETQQQTVCRNTKFPVLEIGYRRARVKMTYFCHPGLILFISRVCHPGFVGAFFS
jgi:hypothetical protein